MNALAKLQNIESGKHLLCSLYDREQVNSQPIKSFIHQRFLDSYGADITQFMPLFMSINDGHDIKAVAGLRTVEDEELFLEKYLDVPIEQAISEKISGKYLSRAGITEIGNLAANDCEATRKLFLHIAAYTYLQGQQWLVCNATKRVQAIFRYMNLPFKKIQESDKKRIPNYLDWGKYYDGKSHIMTAQVNEIYDVFNKDFTESFNIALEFSLDLKGSNERSY